MESTLVSSYYGKVIQNDEAEDLGTAGLNLQKGNGGMFDGRAKILGKVKNISIHDGRTPFHR